MTASKDIKVSVIITTYERPKALNCVLASLITQKIPPFEVIIADDGSKKPTEKTIKIWQKKMSWPLIHIRQEDFGFRAGSARNMAAKASKGDYLIFLDGDCLVFPDFIKRHIELAEDKKMVMGSRILCSKELTERIENEQAAPTQWRIWNWISAKKNGQINRLFPLLRIGDTKLRTLRPKKWKGIRTFNLAVWRNDFLEVNGFDERFEGWGHEDADLAIRLMKYGVIRKDGQFSLPVLHLWHKESDRSSAQRNQDMIELTINSPKYQAQIGVNQHV